MSILILSSILLVLILFIFWQISSLVSLIFGTPFVRTPEIEIKKAFKLASLKPHELVYDLGAGDGRVLIIAARDFKAKALGFEVSPWSYLLSCWHLKRAKINPFPKVVFGDFRKADLNKADVIYLYLMPRVIEKLERKFKNLKKQTPN